MCYRKIIIPVIIAISCWPLSSCKKYLGEKSNQELSTLNTLNDLQAVLDLDNTNNAMKLLNYASDEYYTDNAVFLSYEDNLKNAYLWDLEPENDNSSGDWISFYNNAFRANTVLDNLGNISSAGQEERWNNIKGAALFLRAHYFFGLSQTYAKQYVAGTADGDAGIAVRLTSDFNKPASRATLQKTYDQIIDDLNKSVSLLPANPSFKTRPGKQAAFALLSRVYLIMGDYQKCKQFADSLLNLNSSLINYNTLNTSLSYTFQEIPFLTNPEIIFYTKTDAPLNAFLSPYAITDSNLVALYQTNDIRKAAYFNSPGNDQFDYKGSYSGGYYLFNGYATDEIYLNRAEANARLGNVPAAMQDVNALLINRWKTGTFIPLTASTSAQALSIILQERRKELVNRGTRWSDLRRLNEDPQFATTLKRVLGNQTYTLPPKDSRYVFLIPQEVIDKSGMVQNSR